VVHATSTDDRDVKVGLVVSKAVGNAVVRNRVKRRLRHLCADQLSATPPGTRIVIRALPGAAAHPDELGSDLSRAWVKAMARVRHRDLERCSEGRAGT
jgi:ribonuclease P protein component